MKCTAVGAVGLFTMFARFSGLYWYIFITDFMDIQQTIHREVNNINDQLDATITILLIFESAQNVSGNFLSILSSVGLWFTAMWCNVLML
jgi:hypothetical protein